MGRKTIYTKHKHPYTLVHMIEAIISDYPRRERIINYSAEEETVIAEYKRLNRIIDGAVESLEPELTRIIQTDIINRCGYERSRAALISAKKTYYNRKSKLIHDIAHALNLTGL